MFRRSNKAGPIGLDLGATGLRMLQIGDQDGEAVVIAAAEYPFSPEITEGEQREGLVRQAVEDALRRQPFIGREVVSALSPSEFQIKNLRVPRMPLEEMASAVEFEARERMDLGGGGQIRFLSAGEVRHGNDLKEEVIVFAASDEVILSRVRLLESCRLRSAAIDLAPCAMARGFMRFLRRAADAASVNIFLEVGWRSTSVVITRGSEVSFLKTIDVGGKNLTQTVSEALSISMEEALRLRVRIMQDAASRRAADEPGVAAEMKATVADAEAPLMERLNREVQLCQRYYAVTFRGQPPTSITFVGGDAHEPVLAKALSEASDVPCTVGNPLRGLAGGGALRLRDRRTTEPAWAVAAGLALRGSPLVQGWGQRTAAPAAAGAA